jgi:predicted  nucleic acid-binding Zn-ribbon protein
MKKKITTIEDLAVMIDKEFRGIEKRFDRLEARMDEVEGEVRLVKADIAQLRKDLKEADTRTAVIAIELRVSALEKKVDLSAGKR